MKINLEGIASKMTQNQMKKVLGGTCYSNINCGGTNCYFDGVFKGCVKTTTQSATTCDPCR